MKRFNSVIDQFWDVIDAKSGEILLRPKAMEAVDLLRKHIEADCLSDPDAIALYYTTGKNAAGITTRRCVRGTNSTEVWSVCFTLFDSVLPSTIIYRYHIDFTSHPLLLAYRPIYGFIYCSAGATY